MSSSLAALMIKGVAQIRYILEKIPAACIGGTSPSISVSISTKRLGLKESMAKAKIRLQGGALVRPSVSALMIRSHKARPVQAPEAGLAEYIFSPL
jgi:hypothetical protein